jgi:hypothetical protein
MSKSKTWVKLLGSDCDDCEVSGNAIVRCPGQGQKGRVLWTFSSIEEATEALEEWTEECLEILWDIEQEERSEQQARIDRMDGFDAN